jgi:TPR repeat protein
LPIFYLLAGCLIALAGLSVVSLIGRSRGRSESRGLFLFRVSTAFIFWSLLALWSGITAVMVAWIGLVGGSALGLLAALAILVAWGLVSIALWYWGRGNSIADVGWLLAIALFCGNVYYWQRVWICEPLAHSGFGRAQLCTAKLYESGSGGVIRNQETARSWYGYAAERGVAEAQYTVGKFTRNQQQKTDWLTRAADSGNSDAAVELYFLSQGSDDAMVRLQQASAAGSATAQYYLGNHYRNGTGGLARDLPRARSLLSEAANSGNTQAMQALAIAWARGGILFGHSMEQSLYWEQRVRESTEDVRTMRPLERSQAVNWERLLKAVRLQHEAAEAGDTQAMLALGHEILKQAADDPLLTEKGMAWIERAAGVGSTEAQYEVADYYLATGQTDTIRQAQGRDWLVAAANSGHEKALTRIIKALKEEESGFQRDLERSQTYSEALFEVLDSRGVRPNQGPRMAARWEYADTLKQIRLEQEQYLPPQQLRAQASSGDAIAQYHLGKQRLRTDFEGGVLLLQTSADAGYAQAQFEMAQMIRHRKRTPEEETRAIAWLHEARAAGHRGAMVDLGVLYLQGLARQGFGKNPYRARLLFEASLQGAGEIVYEQKRSGGSWQYTADSVNRWLDRIPAAVKRLHLEGLQGDSRTRAVNEWYARESEDLRKKIDAAAVGATANYENDLQLIGQQRELLLKSDELRAVARLRQVGAKPKYP